MFMFPVLKGCIKFTSENMVNTETAIYRASREERKLVGATLDSLNYNVRTTWFLRFRPLSDN